jgi:hypothetical protein
MAKVCKDHLARQRILKLSDFKVINKSLWGLCSIFLHGNSHRNELLVRDSLRFLQRVTDSAVVKRIVVAYTLNIIVMYDLPGIPWGEVRLPVSTNGLTLEILEQHHYPRIGTTVFCQRSTSQGISFVRGCGHYCW